MTTNATRQPLATYPRASDGLGLYSGIILTDFLETVERPVLDPRPWHGEPVHMHTMIRRAFSGLSSLNYRNIPDNVYQQLRTLLELYTRPHPTVERSDPASPPKKLIRNSQDQDTSLAKTTAQSSLREIRNRRNGSAMRRHGNAALVIKSESRSPGLMGPNIPPVT